MIVVMRACLVAVVVLAACGQDRADRTPAPSVPTRLRLLTDTQFANAVHDLLGINAPPIHTPGSTPHQFVHEDVIALDGARLVEYRLAAEKIGQQLALVPTCSELACSLEFAERAFRRPLDVEEREQLGTLFVQGGFSLVGEAVLQAPSFLYRTEIGDPTGTRAVELDSYELAAQLGFFFFDSLPDAELRAAAADDSLRDPRVLERQVDRLIAEPRVQDHLLAVVLDWLQVHRVIAAAKNAGVYPELTTPLRVSMLGETQRFVRDVLFARDGSLRELLTSRATFLDERGALHYGITTIAGDTFVPYTHDGTQRAGILTHASLLTFLAQTYRQSIIQRAQYVHDTFLCTPELGRPPFDAIAAVASFTGELSESQFAHYRIANAYCATCHRTLDPPGRALERYDGIGRWRERDELGIEIEDDTTIEIDGVARDVRGAIALGELLADSDQVARCTVQRLAQHAFGRELDARTIDQLLERFEASDRNIVEAFRAIATSKAFRQRLRGDP
jgi:hypothetical protein